MKRRRLRLIAEETSPADKIRAVQDAVGGEINGVQIFESPDSPGVIVGKMDRHPATGKEQVGHLINSDGSMNNRSNFWKILFPEEEEAARDTNKKAEAKEKVDAED